MTLKQKLNFITQKNSNGRVSTLPLRTHARELCRLGYKAFDNWTLPQKSISTADCEYQVIDFFSGCGGMSLGFSALSKIAPIYKVIGGFDIDPEAAKTYEINLGAPCIVGDIRELLKEEIAISNLLKKLNYRKRKPLVLIGCAPCQGFTSHRKKNWQKKDDRNSLVNAFADVAMKLKPAAIVMENVPEMLSNKYWSHFNDAKKIFETNGYIVKQAIYNAASFGVPQERFRTIVIAMKKNFLMPDPIIKPGKYLTVRDAISHLPNVNPGEVYEFDSLHRSAEHRKSTIQTIRAIPKNGGSRPPGVGPKCLDKVNGFYDVYGRLHWDKPAITITHYARNPASGRFVHPEQHRGLTMREAALLQSFPKNFSFKGTFDAIFRQIGEAVPPKLSLAIAANVFVELMSPKPSSKELDKSIQPIIKPVSNSYSSVIAGIKNSKKRS